MIMGKGSRDEMIEAVEEVRDGWLHKDRPDMVGKAQEALDGLRRGEKEVRVGRSEYVVSERGL